MTARDKNQHLNLPGHLKYKIDETHELSDTRNQISMNELGAQPISYGSLSNVSENA